MERAASLGSERNASESFLGRYLQDSEFQGSEHYFQGSEHYFEGSEHSLQGSEHYSAESEYQGSEHYFQGSEFEGSEGYFQGGEQSEELSAVLGSELASAVMSGSSRRGISALEGSGPERGGLKARVGGREVEFVGSEMGSGPIKAESEAQPLRKRRRSGSHGAS